MTKAGHIGPGQALAGEDAGGNQVEDRGRSEDFLHLVSRLLFSVNRWREL